MTIAPAMALALAAAQAAGQSSPPAFAVDVEVVRVDVAVTRGGRPVPGLGPADFVLYEDGVAQSIDAVLEERDVSLEATLVLDLSQSVAGPRLDELRRAARGLIDGLRHHDRVALIGFSHQVALLQPLTGDLDLARRAVDAAAGTGSTSLHDALCAALALRIPGRSRSAVLVFSDGVDNTSWLPGSAVEETARYSDSVIYAVVAPSQGRGTRPLDSFLTRITALTGGRVWRSHDGHLQSTFADVLAHLRGRYLLLYTPPSSSGPGWHSLEVKVPGRRGDVLARPGYFRQALPPP